MGKIDPTAKLPPYRQLGEIIAAKIRSGEYPPEMRLPSEAELMEEYELGRSTVRRSMSWLRQQGLVETVATRGSYVIDPASGGPR
jgi:DNA-binding GntR family transcriptional regulator